MNQRPLCLVILAFVLLLGLFHGLSIRHSEDFEAAALYSEPVMSTRVVYGPQPVNPLFIHPLQVDSQLRSLSLRHSSTLPIVGALPDSSAREHTLRYTDMVTFYDTATTDPRSRMLTVTRTPWRAVFICKRNRSDRPFTILDITKPPRLIEGASGPSWLAGAVLEACSVDVKGTATQAPVATSLKALWPTLQNDTLFLLLTEESPLWEELLALDDPFDFVPYKAIDMDRLRVRIPFAKAPTTLAVTNGTAASMTTQAMAFDGVLWGDVDLSPSPAILTILQTIDKGATNSYYSPLFRLYSITERLGLAKAATVEGFTTAPGARESLLTLHIYDELQLRVEPDGLRDYRGVLGTRTWHGLTLRPGDRLRLYDQRPSHHNGYYYIWKVGFHDCDIATYIPNVDPASVTITDQKEKRSAKTSGPFTLVEGDRVGLQDGRRGSINSSGAFVLDPPSETETSRARDPLFVCSNDKSIRTQAACESNIDNEGRHRVRGIWDRPCRRDEECPFYKGAVDGHKGGCQDSGYCEMPVGVTATSFRTYTGSPHCSGCPPSVDPVACCQRSEGRRVYKAAPSDTVPAPLK